MPHYVRRWKSGKVFLFSPLALSLPLSLSLSKSMNKEKAPRSSFSDCVCVCLSHSLSSQTQSDFPFSLALAWRVNNWCREKCSLYCLFLMRSSSKLCTDSVLCFLTSKRSSVLCLCPCVSLLCGRNISSPLCYLVTESPWRNHARYRTEPDREQESESHVLLF